MIRENFSSAEISLHGSGERPLGERANSRKRIADHIVSNIRIVYIYKSLRIIRCHQWCRYWGGKTYLKLIIKI